MVSAADSGGGVSGRPTGAPSTPFSALFNVNSTIERLNTARGPIDDPVAFILHRLHTITLWQRSCATLNLLQLGAALVRGVLRRGQHGAHPLRAFDPELAATSFPTSYHVLDASEPVSAAEEGDEEASTGSRTPPPEWHPPKKKSGTVKTPAATASAETTPPEQQQQRMPRQHRHHHRHHKHRHHHQHHGSSPPSVARRVLVQAAGVAAAELYRGMLISLLAHGVTFLTQQQKPEPHTTTTTTTTKTTTSAATSTASATSSVSTSPPPEDDEVSLRQPAHTTNSNSLSDGRPHNHTISGASHTKWRLLSPEATHALHELHHAAREVVHAMYDDVTTLNRLSAPAAERGAAESAGAEAPRECRGALQSDAPLEVQVDDVYTRLTLLTVNLYSLLSLLDFFSVEAEWAEKASEHQEKTAAAAAAAAAEQIGGGFAEGLSSTFAAVVSAIEDGVSQAPGVAMGLHHHSSPPSMAQQQELQRQRTTAETARTRTTAHATSAVYTVKYFHRLFDAAGGELPRCIYDILAAATLVLSQCDVVWSLAHADAATAATFNATATVVFSAPHLTLLRQLHRLCRRFDVLRHRVYTLLPVSPVRFKVKQIVDWGGFLYGDDPTYRPAEESWNTADLIDFHDGDRHRLYALRLRWAITAANRSVLHRVAAMPYTPSPQVAAAAAAGAVVGERSLFAVPSSASGEANSSRLPVSSLLATLASVGTTRSYGARHHRTPLFGSRAASKGSVRFAGVTDSTSSNKNGDCNAADADSTAAAPASSSFARGVARLSTVPGWVGMRNSGNTCFLNSVVQLLSSAACFRSDLMARVQDVVFRQQSHTPAGTTATTAKAVKPPDVTKLFERYGCRLALVLLLGELRWRAEHHHNDHPVLPDYLRSQLPAPFNDHRQHDASEFLHALLDQLDEPKQPGGAVVRRWWSGQTATTMKCTRCHRARTHVNAFWDLTIPIRSAAATTVAGTAAMSSDSTPQVCTAAVADVRTPTTGAAKQVEVVHFAGATATTTTYVRASEAAVAGEGNGNDSSPASHTDPTAAPPPLLAAAATPSVTLQHLLLHVLHPAMNKELLHGGNALDCEYCQRRTSTALITRLVAELPTEKTGETGTRAEVRQHHSSEREEARVASPDTPANEEAETAAAKTGSSSQGGVSTTTTAPARDAAPCRDEEGNASSSLDVPQSHTDTAAGGAMPFYLAIQLNRFAYQRSTQSYAKVTDGVPLNEVVVVPAYPIEDSAVVDAPTTGEEDAQAEREEEDAVGSAPPHPPTAAALTASVKHVSSLPVWVAYRLRSIIIHSGSTPSSGHYFVLTRSDQHDTQTAPGATGKTEEEATAAALEDVRVYVNELGAGLTSALGVDRVFSPNSRRSESAEAPAPSAAAAATTTTTRPQQQLSEHKKGGSEMAGGEADEKASAVAAPNPAVSASPPPAATAPEVTANVRSPLPTPAPVLPAASIAVTGTPFYEGWVMLNDSNVQPVTAERMRGILGGTGNGVYSALETPYVVLYEKTPLSYACGGVNTGGGGDEGEEERGAAATVAASRDEKQAEQLQRVWEAKSTLSLLQSATSSSAPVELAAEAVAIFTRRLREEDAVHAQRTKTTAGPPSSSRTAGSSMVVPHVHHAAKRNGAVFTTATQAPTAHTASPRTKLTTPLRAPSTTAAAAAVSSNSSKRLRAKAAVYVQHANAIEERAARRRLTQAGVNALPGSDATGAASHEGGDEAANSDERVSQE